MTTIDIKNVSETLTIFLANITANDVVLNDLSGATILGYTGVSGNEYYPLSEYFSFSTINDSYDLPPLVASGTLVVNDGIKDLDVSEGLKHIRYATAFEAGAIFEAQLGSTSFLGLQDTPTTYLGAQDKYLRATASGIDWVTISGVEIENNFFVDLEGTPDYYDDGRYLTSTTSGTEWTTLSGMYYTQDEVDDLISSVSGDGDSACVESNGQSSTTSSNYKTKVTMSRYFSGGDYVVHLSCLFSCVDTGVFTYIRARMDDTVTKKQQIKELYNFKYEDGAYHTYSGHFKYTFSEGSHTIKFQYHTSEGKAMYIKEAVISVYKI